MTVCHHYDDDWELLLLGALSESRAGEMRAHIATGCSACAERWTQASRVLGAVGASLEEMEPPAHVELRLRQRLKKTPQIAAAVGPSSPSLVATRAGEGRRLWWLPMAAAATLVVVVGGTLGLQNRALQHEVAGMRDQLAAATREERFEPMPEPPTVAAPAPEPVVPAPTPAPAAMPAPSAGPAAADDLDARRERQAWVREREQLAGELARAEEARRDAEDRAARLDLALAQARREVVTASAASASGAPTDARVGELEAMVVRLTSEVRRLEADARRVADVNREYLSAMQGALDSRATRVTLRAIDPAAGRATASATLTADGRVLLIARDLPRLPADKCYQLWIIRRDSPVIASGGVVTVGAQGQVLHAARVSDTGGPITGFALTDEPAGGSVESRGRKLLFGSVE